MMSALLLLTSLPFIFSSPTSTAPPLAAPSTVLSQPKRVPPTFTQDHQNSTRTAVSLLGSPHPFIHCPIPNPVWQDCPLVADCQRIILALFPRPREPPGPAPGASSTTGPPRSEPTFAHHHHYPQVFFKRNNEEGEPNDLTKPDEVDGSENVVYTGNDRDPYALPRRFIYGTCEARLYLPSYGPQTERTSWAEIHAAAEDMLRSCQRRNPMGDMVIGKNSYARMGWQRRLIVAVRKP